MNNVNIIHLAIKLKQNKMLIIDCYKQDIVWSICPMYFTFDCYFIQNAATNMFY